MMNTAANDNTASIAPAKAHVRHEALECAGGIASLLPPEATGEDLRQVMADPVKRRQIAAALAPIFLDKEAMKASPSIDGWDPAARAFQRRYEEA